MSLGVTVAGLGILAAMLLIFVLIIYLISTPKNKHFLLIVFSLMLFFGVLYLLAATTYNSSSEECNTNVSVIEINDTHSEYDFVRSCDGLGSELNSNIIKIVSYLILGFFVYILIYFLVGSWNWIQETLKKLLK